MYLKISELLARGNEWIIYLSPYGAFSINIFKVKVYTGILQGDIWWWWQMIICEWLTAPYFIIYACSASTRQQVKYWLSSSPPLASSSHQRQTSQSWKMFIVSTKYPGYFNGDNNMVLEDQILEYLAVFNEDIPEEIKSLLIYIKKNSHKR